MSPVIARLPATPCPVHLWDVVQSRARVGPPSCPACDPLATAAARIEEALALAAQTGQAGTDAFLHRIRRDILLRANPDNPVPAEEAYRTAIAVAREQGARAFELRAALSLAKLYQSTGVPPRPTPY